MTLDHVEGYRRALDVVAGERKYLTMLEAQPEPDTLRFVKSNLENGNPMMVAVAGDKVIGWCDVRREFFPSRAHRGTLGMGLLPEWRGRGVGRRLLGQAEFLVSSQWRVDRANGKEVQSCFHQDAKISFWNLHPTCSRH